MIIRNEPRVRWPVEPHADESLLGLMVRTAGENLHPDIGNILDFAGLDSNNGIGRSMLDPENRRRLAHVLDQPLEVIEARAHFAAGKIHGMDAIDFFGARVPAADILYDRRRVGSTVDKVGFYHRALWQFVHVPVTEQNGAGVTVADRCASCGARLGWRRAPHDWVCSAYHAGRPGNQGDGTSGPYDCGDVGAGANDTPSIVSQAELDAITALTSLLDPRPEVHEAARDALHPDLRALNRGVAFYLGMKLGRAVALEGGGVRLRRGAAAPLAESMAALATGSTILREWPDGVARLVAAKAEQDHERAMAAVSAVRRVCHGESAWPEHRETVTAAMPAIVKGHYQEVVRRVADDAVDGRAAAALIGIRPNNLVRLVRAKQLKPLIARGTAKIHGSFGKADVERVAVAVKDSAEATRMVEEVGITLHGVEQLICERELVHADHPAVEALHSTLRITPSSYERLITRLEEGGSDLPVDEPSVGLRQAVLRIGGREKPWASIIRALGDGELPYRFNLPAGRMIDRITVKDGPELHRVLARTFDRSDHPSFQFATRMRQRDAIELLNIDPSRWQQIARLLPNGIHAEQKKVDIASALKIAEHVIDGREAKARWAARLPRTEMIMRGVGWDRRVMEARHRDPDRRPKHQYMLL